MKKLVLLAAGAIVLLGAVAVAAVLVATRGTPDGPAPAAVPAPPGVTAPPTAPPGDAAPAAPPAAAAPRASRAQAPLPDGPPPLVVPPGVRQLQLPASRVSVQLTPALAPCYEFHAAAAGRPALLAVELEAQAGGVLVVVATSVRQRGEASDALVDCAQRNLRGQRMNLGGYEPGARVITELAVEPPPAGLRRAPEPTPGSEPRAPAGRGNAGR